MNRLIPAGVKNIDGATGRPKNMSSLQYRKCSASPSMWCSWLSTACELNVGSAAGSEKCSDARTTVIFG